MSFTKDERTKWKGKKKRKGKEKKTILIIGHILHPQFRWQRLQVPLQLQREANLSISKRKRKKKKKDTCLRPNLRDCRNFSVSFSMNPLNLWGLLSLCLHLILVDLNLACKGEVLHLQELPIELFLQKKEETIEETFHPKVEARSSLLTCLSSMGGSVVKSMWSHPTSRTRGSGCCCCCCCCDWWFVCGTMGELREAVSEVACFFNNRGTSGTSSSPERRRFLSGSMEQRSGRSGRERERNWKKKLKIEMITIFFVFKITMAPNWCTRSRKKERKKERKKWRSEEVKKIHPSSRCP